MKRVATILAGLIALVAVATPAFAALRVPQVPVATGSLQGFLNGQGESINVLTDQNAVQRWTSTISTNTTLTLQVELSGNAASNNLGLYNANDILPLLYQVFPGVAGTGWFAVASFRTLPSIRVIVTLFNASAVLQGSNTYLGADRNDFGFYLQGTGGLFFSQDARNPGGDPQAVTYAGTGVNSGSWWVCFEDRAFSAGSDRDFDDAVLFCESLNPVPVSKTTWGSVKARFR